jgi:uncharacterized membrane protein
MDRSTKLLVAVWACAAIAADTWLTPGWRQLSVLTAGSFVTAAVLTAFKPGAVGIVLALTYVFPALIRLTHGPYHVSYDVVWMSALLGAIMPDVVRTRWHVPARWRPVLVGWALIVVSGATLVALREVNFDWRLLSESRMPTESLGGVPRFDAGWVLHVALNLVIGILWFDWLFGSANVDFRRSIVAPMAASCLVMVTVAIYQKFGDLGFLNDTVYFGLGRATGTLFDANVCGVIAAVWMGGVVLYARDMASWRRWFVLVTGLTAGWLAVWATASRTAFGAALIVTGFVLVDAFRERSSAVDPQKTPRLRLEVGLLLGAIVLAVVVGLSTGGPIRRFQQMARTSGSFTGVLTELWNRNEYGRRAAEMIADYPLFGVGVGSYHLLVRDYARMYGGPSVPDNAQNWYRHQLTEFGVVGSLGWIAWVLLFAGFVLRRRSQNRSPPGVRVARGMLLAFAIVSLVGMPGQSITMVITFWTVAFWFVSLIGAPPSAAPPRTRTWALVVVVLLAYVAGTADLAATSLRASARAQRAGRAYAYGFYGPEPGEAGSEQRWTRRRSAIVLDASGSWMALSVGAHYPPFESRPVDVKVWIDGKRILTARLDTTQPITENIRIPDGRRRVLLETWVSRVLRPRDFGIADDRELGLLVKWAFTDVAPGTPKTTASRRLSPNNLGVR